MRNYHVLTLFPEMILEGLHTSIIGRAIEHKAIRLEAVNIRDYADNKHQKVDDYPYGGGAGMVMQAEPVYQACQAVQKQVEQTSGRTSRVIYVTPQGTVFRQSMAEELAKEENLIFLCGHYEGIDERVLEEVVTDYVSIGDYVLTGGELPAMVMIDAIARLVPGVLSNEASAEFESFHENLLEYPQYSRPKEWRGKQVPDVLLSGNHTHIEGWRKEHSILRTRKRRPDLYEIYQKELEGKSSVSGKKLKGVILGISKERLNTLPFSEEFWELAEAQQLQICQIEPSDRKEEQNEDAWDVQTESMRYQQAQKSLGLHRSRLIVLADTVREVQAAREAGLRVIYLSGEKGKAEPKELIYYRKISDLIEAMAILRSMM